MNIEDIINTANKMHREIFDELYTARPLTVTPLTDPLNLQQPSLYVKTLQEEVMTKTTNSTEGN